MKPHDLDGYYCLLRLGDEIQETLLLYTRQPNKKLVSFVISVIWQWSPFLFFLYQLLFNVANR